MARKRGMAKGNADAINVGIVHLSHGDKVPSWLCLEYLGLLANPTDSQIVDKCHNILDTPTTNGRFEVIDLHKAAITAACQLIGENATSAE
jgi:hypothetical protein